MTFDASRPATWYVIDKRSPHEGGRGVVAKYTSDAFISFHSINAYEEPSSTHPGETDVVCDIAAYENMDVLHHFYLDNILSDLPKAHAYTDSLSPSARPVYRRYRLPSIPTPSPSPAQTPKTTHSPKQPPTAPALLIHSSPHETAFELPVINPLYVTRKHRYMYGIADTGKSTFVDGLVRYDAETHQVPAMEPTRAKPRRNRFSSPDPAASQDGEGGKEDAGVLLSVVLDGYAGKSYLLVLDARTMTEVGRAHVDGVVGFGFHGMFCGE